MGHKSTVKFEILISLPLHKYPEMRLLHHVCVIFNVLESFILSSIMAVHQNALNI